MSIRKASRPVAIVIAGPTPVVRASGGGACSNLHMKWDGNQLTRNVRCTDPDMTGIGEMIYKDQSSCTGTIRFTSAGGHKLPGECDSPQ